MSLRFANLSVDKIINCGDYGGILKIIYAVFIYPGLLSLILRYNNLNHSIKILLIKNNKANAKSGALIV